MKYLCIALVFVAGCSTAVTIKDANGNTMSGSLMNGSMSMSSGTACVPAVPSPASPIPPGPSSTPPLMFERATNGRLMLVQQGAADSLPTCNTTVATVRGTDTTTFFAMLLAGAAAAIIGLK